MFVYTVLLTMYLSCKFQKSLAMAKEVNRFKLSCTSLPPFVKLESIVADMYSGMM